MGPIYLGASVNAVGSSVGFVCRGGARWSLGVGHVGWGGGLFAFAFITHATSATDVLRQASFPSYPSRMALMIFAGALAFDLTCLALFFLSVIARPGFEADGAGSGFLVQLLGLPTRV